MICLPALHANKFIDALKSGDIDPAKLSKMSSDERHNFFSKIVGEENSKFVNSTFESKMLLKNQKYAYTNWAKKVAGLKPEVRRDLISRISRLDHVLDPEQEDQFLKDLASTKLGVDVTQDEAKTIADMSSKVQELEAQKKEDGTFPSEEKRLEYGRAKVDLGNYVSKLKQQTNKTAVGDLFKHPVKTTSKIAGTAKSIKAAFDDSALLRQGWKTLLTHPNIWRKNAQANIKDLYKQGIKNEDITREVTADILSRPNAKYYEKMGISPKIEEEFGDPSLIIKTPGIGRLYKTTEAAFNAFMLRNRADLADYYLDLAKKAGVEIDDPKELKPIGHMIGGLTGRGNLGGLERSANTANNVFFSPRFIKSQIDTVMHPLTGAGGSNFVRKEAAKNLVKIVGLTAAIFGTANAIRPGSVELDPRSSNFGKVKIGDTTFDMTGGSGAIAILASRLLTQETKATKSGILSKLGSSPVTPTGGDLIENFVTGKLSPVAQRVWVNLVSRQEYSGAKPTAGSNVSNLFAPLPVTTYLEAKHDPHGANALVTEAADSLGISANTIAPQTKNWSTNPTKKQEAFQQKVSKPTFKQANNDYNTAFNDWSVDHQQDLRKLPQDQQQSITKAAQQKIEDEVMHKYGFTYKQAKRSKSETKARKQTQTKFLSTV